MSFSRLFFYFFIFLHSFLVAQIAVVSLAQGEAYQKKVQLGLKSKAEYCEKKGYKFILQDSSLDPSRHIYWSKILLVREVLNDPSLEWVAWIDADTLIMNHDIPVEVFMDEKYNFIISQDWNGINAGIFFIKNCEWSKRFLEAVYNRKDCLDHVWPEQEAITRTLRENNEFGLRAKIVPQRLFNSYCKEILGEHESLETLFQKGDFILHFAGCNAVHPHLLPKLMKKYYSLRDNNRSSFFNLDQFLGRYGFELNPIHSLKNEGYVSKTQANAFQKKLAVHPEIQSVLEVGLNGGHSAENFFMSCSNLKHFVSFDLNQHSYTKAAIEYFRMKYGHEFEFVEGNSQETIPEYVKRYPNKKFDLIYIDGGHSYDICMSDIMNCAALAHKNTLLWIDDYCGAIEKAVKKLERYNRVKIDEVRSVCDDSGHRAWVEAHYILK